MEYFSYKRGFGICKCVEIVKGLVWAIDKQIWFNNKCNVNYNVKELKNKPY